jgi:hypothetical protein
MTQTVPGTAPPKGRSKNALCKPNRWIVQQFNLEQANACEAAN